MKKQTVFISDDEKRFDSEQECLEWESLVDKIRQIMSELVTSPEDSDFHNGGGYIQQNPATVEKVKNTLLNLWTKDAEIVAHARTVPARYSIIGRIWCDSGSPLWPAWNLLCNIDPLGREWGQQYFVINPDKAKQIRLNP